MLHVRCPKLYFVLYQQAGQERRYDKDCGRNDIYYCGLWNDIYYCGLWKKLYIFFSALIFRRAAASTFGSGGKCCLC